jgi:mono/diheme cytochrome c family protein
MNSQATRAGSLLVALLLASATLAMAQQRQNVRIKPGTVTPTSVTSGKEMFNEYCASCHGMNAKGDGPAAPALKVRPPDLTTLAERHGGRFPAKYVESVLSFGAENLVAHGAKDMPVWGPVLSSIGGGQTPARTELRIYNITRYIESLQAK